MGNKPVVVLLLFFLYYSIKKYKTKGKGSKGGITSIFYNYFFYIIYKKNTRQKGRGRRGNRRFPYFYLPIWSDAPKAFPPLLVNILISSGLMQIFPLEFVYPYGLQLGFASLLYMKPMIFSSPYAPD
jgi:hypothetical protein